MILELSPQATRNKVQQRKNHFANGIHIPKVGVGKHLLLPEKKLQTFAQHTSTFVTCLNIATLLRVTRFYLNEGHDTIALELRKLWQRNNAQYTWVCVEDISFLIALFRTEKQSIPKAFTWQTLFAVYAQSTTQSIKCLHDKYLRYLHV